MLRLIKIHITNHTEMQMSKYRKIEARIWNDAKFNKLSDDAKLLFFFLLSHPHLTALGAMRATPSGLANELNWTEKAFREAFGELLQKHMVKASEKACFIWLPNFLKYNKPENPNVVKSWDKWLEYLPECSLTFELIQEARAIAKGLGEAFAKALPKAFAKGMPNHEHEHEHEHEHDIIMRQPIFSLKLNDGNCYSIFEQELEYWKNHYPEIDVNSEFKKMFAWLDSNPSKRKTLRGIKRFINSWLSRIHDSQSKNKKQDIASSHAAELIKKMKGNIYDQ